MRHDGYCTCGQISLRLCIVALGASVSYASSPSIDSAQHKAKFRSWEDIVQEAKHAQHQKHATGVHRKLAWKDATQDNEINADLGSAAQGVRALALNQDYALQPVGGLGSSATNATPSTKDTSGQQPLADAHATTDIDMSLPFSHDQQDGMEEKRMQQEEKPKPNETTEKEPASQTPVAKPNATKFEDKQQNKEQTNYSAPKQSLPPGIPGIGIPSAADSPDIFDNLRNAMVRISTLDKTINILRPYDGATSQESVGSGFIVDFPSVSDGPDDITIITNAHVVKSAKLVRVQLPSLGRKFFDADVPLICFKFDLAVVKLSYSSELSDQLTLLNTTVQRLKLQSRFVEMGLRVAALGFPLGSEWLKLSEGVIAGEESVNENMVYQSTAPISPGNSGGPLLVFRTNGDKILLDTVLGANFATEGSTNAQNLNYAVPAFRIKQVLKLYAKLRQGSTEQLDEVGTGSEEHVSMKLPPVGLVYTQSTPAQIAASKCETGIQIDKIKTYSIFRWADPPVSEQSFLVKIDNVELDVFGMGKRPDYMESAVSFKDLLTFRSSLDEEVNVTTCKHGKHMVHKLSLRWNTTRFESGLRYVDEPAFDAGLNSYELFAGVTLMELTLNHIEAWTSQEGYDTLARFSLDENMVGPRVAITSCTPGSLCDDILTGGMILESINHCKHVTTLQEVRSCFVPDGTYWELVTDQGFIFVADFMEELKNIVEEGKPQTKAVMAALNRGLLPGYSNETANKSMLQNDPTGGFQAEEAQDRRVMRRAEVRVQGEIIESSELAR